MEWLSKVGFWGWPVSGLLLGVGFVFPILWLCGILGVVVFLYQSVHSKSFLGGMLGAWLAWTIKAALSIIWLWSTYPIDWLPPGTAHIQLLLVGLYWLLSAVAIGLGGVAAYICVRILRRFSESAHIIFNLLISFCWVGAEVIGSYAYAVVMLGPGGSVTHALSFSYVGYLLVELPKAVLLAQVAGVYGLSFLLVCFAVMVFMILTKRLRWSWIPFAITLFVFVLVAGAEKIITHSESVSETQVVVTIDTKFPAHFRLSTYGTELRRIELDKAIEAALTVSPDYILLPEDARYFNPTKVPYLELQDFARRFESPELMVIDSGRTFTEDKTVLRSFVYTGATSSIVQVDKRYLVPQGEYLSYWLRFLLEIFGQGVLVEQSKRDLSYEVGDKVNQSVLLDGVPSILFCFESIDPLGARRVLSEHPSAPFVAHPISHEVFHAPYRLWQQLDTMLRVQAVWNGVYIISAGNFAEGKVYTPKGKLMPQSIIASGDYWVVKRVVIPQAPADF